MNLYSTTYDFKHIYDLDKLKQYDEYAQNDIKRALEYIEKVKAYQQTIYEHARQVALTEFEYVVILERSTDYRSNLKYYHVTLHHRPKGITKVDYNHVYGKRSEQKQFKGTERHQAFKYANELATNYHCSIEKKGFPRKEQPCK